jgi:lysyl-tRNA synthetase, class II
MARVRPPSGRPLLTRRLAALATALAGLLTVASSLSPNAPARQRLLEGLEPHAAQAAAHAAGVVGGLVVMWLAAGVLQGRRSWGRAALAVLGTLAIVHAVKGLDYEEALVGLAVAVGLHRSLREGAHGSPALLAGLAALVALAGAYAVALTTLLVAPGTPKPEVLLLRAAEGSTGVARVFGGAPLTATHLLVALAAGCLVAALRALLSPARALEGHGEAEHARLAGLVAAHGEDSIAPFALRADKAFHFAAGGAVAYRVLGETAVVAGDPIGPPGSAPRVLASFVEHAYARGWDVVVMGAGSEHLGEYAALGLRAMQVGLEAVVDPRTFDLASPAAKTVRKACHRVRRHGWTVEIVRGAELVPALARELAAVDMAWRRRGHRRLYGFAMAHDRLWGAPEDAGDLYALARDPAGELRAFQRYVRYRRGYSLDAMRRLDDDPNGISDSLVAAVLERCAALGCEEVSLNFSGFGHLLAAGAQDGVRARLACWALRRLRRRFQLERLARFAQKFGPQWRPRFVVFTARTRLPVAAVRVLQAEAYLPARPVRRRGGAWRPAAVPLAGMLAGARR